MGVNDEKQEEVSRFEGESHHGWAPDVDSGGGTAAKAGAKATDKPSPATGEGREISQEEREGVSSTDMEPGSPFGAGENRNRRGEEIAEEAGVEAEGHKGPSQRPYGTSDAGDATGVNPQDPRDPESPNVPPA